MREQGFGPWPDRPWIGVEFVVPPVPVLQWPSVNALSALAELLLSPVGPPLVLVVAVPVVWMAGRRAARGDVPRWVALGFWVVAVWQTMGMRFQATVPSFAWLWHPLVLEPAYLYWLMDGWNWYISSLLLLLGGVALLLGGFGVPVSQLSTRRARLEHTTVLMSYLGLMAAGLLFVNSGNLLTLTLTWVVMDLVLLLRYALVPHAETSTEEAHPGATYRAQGFSLLGALLLLIGLLPAGPSGPGQPLLGGTLPIETVMLMLLAGAVRAGAYPFHLWLLPSPRRHLRLADRFVDHMVPALAGLWLLGWASALGRDTALLWRQEFVALVLAAFLASAVAAFTATEKPGHTTFVLITSVGSAAITSIFAEASGPAAVLWPTTVFALAGGLWLVGERIWLEWGWQLPVSLGALALLGVPFTPGFFTQSAVARLLSGQFLGSLVLPFFVLFLMAQTFFVAALLRSWGAAGPQHPFQGVSGLMWGLLFSSIILAIPLVIAGIFPQVLTQLVGLREAIPADAGTPPSAVAGPPVWVTMGIPLVLGIGLALLRQNLFRTITGSLGNWPRRLSFLFGLDWLSMGMDRAMRGMATVWDNGLAVLEGTGHLGWVLVFVAMGVLFFL